ncbi:MAG: chaperone NapD [Desulfobulbaceae bacterium]|nr:chaperone NapD [Desulfobulbaceae bacterium]
MDIAGVLVHARPGRAEEVEARLRLIPGVEVHAKTDDNRLVVTIEDHPDAFVSDTLMSLYQLDGVLAAAMVYQHSEELDCTAS